MKIVHVLALLILYGCNAQSKTREDKNMKTFDIATFEKNKIDNAL